MKTPLIISLVVSGLIFSCQKSTDNDAKQKKLVELRKQESEIRKQIEELEKEIDATNPNGNGKLRYVGVTKIQPKIFDTYIDVQGKIDSDENVALSSEMPGTITKIYVQIGDKVSKGQVLAETDNRAILQGIEEIKTNLQLVNTLYEKQKNLWEQKIGTEVQYLQVKTQKESLESRLASMNEQLKMTKIISPIDGVVDELNIKLGSVSSPGLPSIRVVNFNKLKAKAELAENYAKKIKRGDKVIVVIPDTKDTVKATVSYAARVINPLNRTFNVEVDLPNEEFHPNMVAKLMINNYNSGKPVIVIPVGTIQTDLDGQEFVFVSRGNKAVKQPIKKGNQYNGEVEIIEGLQANDMLITTGYETVNEGDLLSVK